MAHGSKTKRGEKKGEHQGQDNQEQAANVPTGSSDEGDGGKGDRDGSGELMMKTWAVLMLQKPEQWEGADDALLTE